MVKKYVQEHTVVDATHQQVWTVAFNHLDPAHHDLVASVCGRVATVYRWQDEGPPQVLQVYKDSSSEEEFYVCDWSIQPDTSAPLLLVAGQCGHIKALDTCTARVVQVLTGAGSEVDDLRVQHTDPALVLSCGKDRAVRLWHLTSGTCILVTSMSPHAVLTVDWHPWDPDLFLSAGVDVTVNIWSLAGVRSLVDQASTWDTSTAAWPTRTLAHKVFCSTQLHTYWVDCARWVGDLVLSKGVDQPQAPGQGRVTSVTRVPALVLWRPLYSTRPMVECSERYELLREFQLPSCALWWVRFSCSATGRLLACGNCENQVHLWDPLGRPPAHQADPRGQPQAGEAAAAVLRPAKSGLKHENATVFRCTAVSADGRVVVAARGDGALIWYQQQGAQPVQAAAPGQLLVDQLQSMPAWSGSGIEGDSHTVAATTGSGAAGTSGGAAGGVQYAARRLPRLVEGLQVDPPGSTGPGPPSLAAAGGSGMSGAVGQQQQQPGGSRGSAAAGSRAPVSFGSPHEGCSDDPDHMELDEDVATSPLGKGQ